MADDNQNQDQSSLLKRILLSVTALASLLNADEPKSLMPHSADVDL
jgi:hypothetical protein